MSEFRIGASVRLTEALKVETGQTIQVGAAGSVTTIMENDFVGVRYGPRHANLTVVTPIRILKLLPDSIASLVRKQE